MTTIWNVFSSLLSPLTPILVATLYLAWRMVLIRLILAKKRADEDLDCTVSWKQISFSMTKRYPSTKGKTLNKGDPAT